MWREATPFCHLLMCVCLNHTCDARVQDAHAPGVVPAALFEAGAFEASKSFSVGARFSFLVYISYWP